VTQTGRMGARQDWAVAAIRFSVATAAGDPNQSEPAAITARALNKSRSFGADSQSKSSTVIESTRYVTVA
jgi:hypothetical protein